MNKNENSSEKLIEQREVSANQNRATFKQTYRESLREAVDQFPEMYAWPDKSDANVEVVANRMFDAIDRNTFNHDSKAFKITARKLGIKPTRTAIKAFWNQEAA